jgi:nicotinamide mononucleotide transporter
MKTKIFTPSEWFLILGVLLSNVIYSCLSGELDLVGMVASVTGLLCVVLVAKGNIWNYLFGLVNVSLYAYISFNATAYGDAALNALYYVPMQFIGYFAWKRRVSDTTVKARRLSVRQRLWVSSACVVLTVMLGFVLLKCGDGQPFKDSATTVLSIVAQALMAMAFMEQWVLWILTNVISVVMWISFALNGTPHAAVMVIMWTFYLLNSINGLRAWMRLSREDVSKED